MIFNAPEGVFGNPNAITQCTSLGLRARPVPAELPGRADHGLRQLQRQSQLPARHGADLSTSIPGANETALLRLHRADARTSRSRSRSRCAPASDYGLRFTVSEHHPAHAARRRRPDLLGLPRRSESTTSERFPKGTPGNPAGCPGWRDTSCIVEHRSRPSLPDPSADRQPDDLHRRAAGQRGSPSRPTRTPATSTSAKSTYPADRPAARTRPSTRSSTRDLTTNETDSRLGLEPRAQRAAVPRLSPPSPSQLRTAIVTLPRADDQPRRRRRADRLHATRRPNFGTEAPADCPDNSKIGTFRSDTPALDGPLVGSIYIGEPSPATSTGCS